MSSFVKLGISSSKYTWDVINNLPSHVELLTIVTCYNTKIVTGDSGSALAGLSLKWKLKKHIIGIHVCTERKFCTGLYVLIEYD